MRWSKDYESGLPDIDAQHRQMFELIKQIGTIDVNDDRSRIRELIVELERVTREHFTYEEQLMVDCDYPDLEKHAADHASLMLELVSYKENTVFGASKLALVLSNWLLSHVVMQDRPLAQHVAAMSSEPQNARLTAT
jgi:hemerythrin